MPKVKFLPSGTEIEVDEGYNLLDAALDNDVQIDHNCGGNCACSTCHVIIEEGIDSLEEKSEDEIDMLDEAEGLTKNSRLACQCEITKDMVVKVPSQESDFQDDTF